MNKFAAKINKLLLNNKQTVNITLMIEQLKQFNSQIKI
jgi:hypothetical protein